RDQREHRQRGPGRTVDMQRPIQPAMDPRVRKAGSEMTFRSRLRHVRKAVLLTGAAASLAAGAVVASSAAPARAATGPCDIYGNAGTPCVAAHSTTRALYGSYSGPLYQVRRASDGATPPADSGLMLVVAPSEARLT